MGMAHGLNVNPGNRCWRIPDSGGSDATPPFPKRSGTTGGDPLKASNTYGSELLTTIRGTRWDAAGAGAGKSDDLIPWTNTVSRIGCPPRTRR